MKINNWRILMWVVAVVGLMMAPVTVSADQESLEQEKEKIEDKLTATEASFVELLEDMTQVEAEEAALNDQIKENEVRLDELETDIENETKRHEELEEELQRLEDDIDERLTLLGERAATYQKNGSNTASYLGVILGAEGFGDLVSRVMIMSQIAQADQHIIDQLEINQEKLHETEAEILISLETLDEKQEELAQESDELDGRQHELEAVMTHLEEQETELQSMISLLEEEKSSILEEQEALKIQAQLKAEQEEQERQQAQAAAKEKQQEQEQKQKEEQEQSSQQNNEPSQEESAPSNETASSPSTESSTPSESAKPSNSGNWRSFTATAYTAYCAGCSGVTFTGIDLRANPNAKVIAVDPNVIPLGSRVEVKGYGTFTAGDTGGAIKGEKIDIFMPDRSDALSFGRQTVQIRVLN